MGQRSVRQEKQEMESRCMGLFLLLLLVLATQEVVGEEEKRMCRSRSCAFRGMCFSSHNCGLVCKSEGFESGMCVGFRRRCYCIKPCPAERRPGGAMNQCEGPG